LGASHIASHGVTSRIGANAHADLSVFSFHPVKAIAMGEGGAVTTDDPVTAERLVRARNHGMTRDPKAFTNLAGAFDGQGNPNPWYYEPHRARVQLARQRHPVRARLSQLAKLERFLMRRREIVAAYDGLLAPYAPLVRPLGRTRNCLPAWHLYVARIDFEAAGLTRAQLMRALSNEGIGTQVHYFPVHRQPYYAQRYPATLPGADRYYARCLSLPLSAAMDVRDAGRVVDCAWRAISISEPRKRNGRGFPRPFRIVIPPTPRALGRAGGARCSGSPPRDPLSGKSEMMVCGAWLAIRQRLHAQLLL